MDKLSVLLVTPDREKIAALETAIRRHVMLPTTIYTAQDGIEGQAKLRNAPARIVITDFQLGKVKGPKFIDEILADRNLASCAVIILDHPPENEIYLDELVTGRVQFVHDWRDEKELNHRLVRALNFTEHGDNAVFHLRFLAEGDELIKEGERADYVYILKKGRLRAYRNANGHEILLGEISAGEFVGEMAYIHGEARSANVRALNDCELIEVPVGTLDKLLYRRPSWSKMLVLTLSKRLKQANEIRSSGV